jgi:hypothetical protein
VVEKGSVPGSRGAVHWVSKSSSACRRASSGSAIKLNSTSEVSAGANVTGIFESPVDANGFQNKCLHRFGTASVLSAPSDVPICNALLLRSKEKSLKGISAVVEKGSVPGPGDVHWGSSACRRASSGSAIKLSAAGRSENVTGSVSPLMAVTSGMARSSCANAHVKGDGGGMLKARNSSKFSKSGASEDIFLVESSSSRWELSAIFWSYPRNGEVFDESLTRFRTPVKCKLTGTFQRP